MVVGLAVVVAQLEGGVADGDGELGLALRRGTGSRREHREWQLELPLIDDAVVPVGRLVAAEPLRECLVRQHPGRTVALGLEELHGVDVVDVAVGEDGGVEPLVGPVAGRLDDRLGMERTSGVDDDEAVAGPRRRTTLANDSMNAMSSVIGCRRALLAICRGWCSSIDIAPEMIRSDSSRRSGSDMWSPWSPTVRPERSRG